MFTIGQLAKAVEVNVETVRYYERQGLIKQPPKPVQGYRRYPQDTLLRLMFIRRAQGLGFTLHEIASLISLSVGHCSDIQLLAEKKLLTVRIKIDDLQRLEHSLTHLVDQCRHNPDEACCPIITSLVPEHA
ncbi:Hg(II)-responsive transcriptional regulator [Shewanella psychrophila]|uniref:Mercuric resistance operon regulatory protein n=1 Tax=Shewanella psychrophila TaxID=225848 RepID=A0A1S6HUR8_9GAMM|nr:Hg(II)-responsive transcriptional regulator [Shewanella psychrophila]AQS39297.1 Hg(II)-responsive transcriptional regulator [Shewanella psychrophila]